MITVWKTELFTAWYCALKDKRACARIDMRIRRLQCGNFGDAKSVGDSVYELRIDYGPGYRVYYKFEDREIVLLLSEGSTSTQSADITRAKELAKDIVWK